MRLEKCQVFLTGSSAKMLSKEIASQMRGRSLTHELFPFSFAEFLDFKTINKNLLNSKNRILIQNALEEYFIIGGFPEVLDLKKEQRVMIHQEYYKTILHRDVIERYDAIHPQAVLQAGHRLITSVASLFTLNRLTDYLKSLGFKLSKDFVSSCVQWFEDCFFLFPVKIYDRSLAKQNVNPRKIYCIDHSMISSIDPGVSEKKGFLLENMVFIEMRRQTEKIFYYKTQKNKEVDFIIIDNKGKKKLIQVCLSLKEEETRKRETSALFEAMTEQKLNNAIIVTLNEKDTIVKEKLAIDVLPAWQFLLHRGHTL